MAAPINSAAPAAPEQGLLRGIPLTGTGRRSGGEIGQRYGFRHLVMARPFTGG